MANILGRLLVELGVNTTSFLTGMNAASKEAKKTGKDIEDAFDHVGEALTKALGSFGEVGSKISELGEGFNEAFASVGAGGSGLGVAIGAIAGVGPAAVGAAAGLSALAIEGTEVIERLDHISQKTGIGTHDLLTFEAAGKTAGVSLEDMVAAFRKFDQAITGNGKNAGAAQLTLKSLGITARDNREALLQAADAFKGMEDGPTKAADAVALFGKAGLNMIPFLNKGREGVEEFEEAVNVFGPKITAQGIEATEKWKTSVEKLSLAWDGLKVNLSEKILPALASVATEVAGLVRGFDVLGGAIATTVGAAGRGDSVTGALAGYFAGRTAETAGPSDADRKAEQNKQDAIAAYQSHYLGLLKQEQGITQQQIALDDKKQEIQELIQQGKTREAAEAQREIPFLQAAVEVENQRLATLTRIAATRAAIDSRGEVRPLAQIKSPRAGSSPLFNLPDQNPAPNITGLPEGIPTTAPIFSPSQFGAANKEAQQFFAQYIRDTSSAVDNVNADYDLQFEHWTELLDKQEISQKQFNAISAGLDKERTLGLIAARQKDGTSTLTDSFQSMFKELSNSGRDFSRSLASDVGGAIQGLNSQLADLAVTGKANFKQLAQGLEGNVVQTGLKKLESVGIDALGLGGVAGGKPDGTQMNPIYVMLANDGTLGSLGGSSSGSGGLLGKLFSGGGSDDSDSDSSGGIGGILSSVFGGFRAGGGDVTPGKAYVVGEKRPELFMPGRSGSIAPAIPGGGDVHQHFSPTFNIQTPDADSFKKSKSQLLATMHKQSAVAFARGGA
jgi:hypothetical protein